MHTSTVHGSIHVDYTNHQVWGVLQDDTTSFTTPKYNFSGTPQLQGLFVYEDGRSGTLGADFDNLKVEAFSPTHTQVSGTITLGDCNDPIQVITFEFRPKDGGAPFKVRQALTQSGPDSGTFSLPNIPAGTYDIAIKGYCWLQRVIPNVVVNGNVSGLSATLISSDLNNDNQVDIADFGILVNDYGAIGDP